MRPQAASVRTGCESETIPILGSGLFFVAAMKMTKNGQTGHVHTAAVKWVSHGGEHGKMRTKNPFSRGGEKGCRSMLSSSGLRYAAG